MALDGRHGFATPRRRHWRTGGVAGHLLPSGAEAHRASGRRASAAQRLLKMVSIAGRDSIILQSIHLDGALLVPVYALSRSLMCLPLLLSAVDVSCA